LRNWDLAPGFDAETFTAPLPAGAVTLDQTNVNAVGAFMPGPEQ
jgi:hypothetical protein